MRVIVGRAGIGKSFLFRALFDRLYGDFISAKTQQRTTPRPIPLLPEHLKGTYALRTEALIDNFLRTDVAAPVVRETFEWLLVNGFATWLLDGLDELYAGDPGFFEYLFNLIASTNSKAQITIWCRDSVLTTSDPFAEFRDFCDGLNVLKIYRLSEWERVSKRQFAWLHLEGRLPKSGEHDSGTVNAFLTAVDSSHALRSLSGLPLYCGLLLQQHQAGTLQDFTDDGDVLWGSAFDYDCGPRAFRGGEPLRPRGPLASESSAGCGSHGAGRYYSRDQRQEGHAPRASGVRGGYQFVGRGGES